MSPALELNNELCRSSRKTMPRRRAGPSDPRLSRSDRSPRTIDISNSFIMILLRSNKNNVPGMIHLQDNDGLVTTSERGEATELP